MKDLLMITHFTQLPGEDGNGRFKYLIDKIIEKKTNVKVEVITTSFSHKLKEQRNFKTNTDYKITTIYEPGYYKNVSLNRFYSHFIFSRNIKKYLKTRKKPDIIYCAVPSLDVAKVAAEYANKNDIKFIIDVQDLWPEAFKMVFNIPIISHMIFFPMKKQADYIYSSADIIIGVSQTYVDRALKVSKKCDNGHSVYLGTELGKFDIFKEYKSMINKPSGEIWLTYLGTLGHSYNLPMVFDALKILQYKGINNIKFIVMGDGPLMSYFQKQAEEKEINVEFTGRLPYEKMIGVLNKCDIAVNPIKRGSAGSIINKVGDYAMAGLPVVNTQENEEYRNLLEKYHAGINCENENTHDIAQGIYRLYSDNELREKMGNNNRLLAEEKFNRDVTYKEIINLL